MPREPLRILITNWTLAEIGGSQLYVRDLAVALLARGHRPVVYSQIHGKVADQIREAAIPVVSRLDQIGSPPHIIHGHHHVETMSALLRFGGVPAIYVCHGPLPMQEAPPESPRVLRYLAVSKASRDRLVLQHGVPEDKVELVLSFVDMNRFRARDPLPKLPRRALVFGNHFTEGHGLPEIRAACEQAGLSLDERGEGVGRFADHPERLLAQYDIVFGKARCALEALAVGCAVVLCSYEGVGPPVRPGNLDWLRLNNFGAGVLTNTLSTDLLLERITQYDVAEAGEASRRIRESADIETVVDRIEQIYREALAEFERAAPADPLDELRSASDYLEQWGPTFYAWQVTAPFERTVARLEAELARRGRHAKDLEEKLANGKRHVNNMEGELAHRTRQVTDSAQESAALKAELKAVYASASWRWVQGFLRFPVIRAIIGPLVRKVARGREGISE